MLAAEESSQSWPTYTEKCQDTQNDNRASADSSEPDESDNNEHDSVAIDSGGDDSSDIILVLTNERPNVTRSGRAVSEEIRN